MGEQIIFRPLTANEIECRVGNVAQSGSGFFLLLYKNARVDQVILDETFGPWNWQCKYYQVKNTMVCSVGIRKTESDEWIWKDNGGDDDYQAEQVKAELSDAFKRACFNWGIGRELYYSPKIWVKAEGDNTTKARYSVKVIDYDERKHITQLVIINDKTKEVVFEYGKPTKATQNGESKPKNTTPSAKETQGSIDSNDLKTIQAFLATFDENKKNQFYIWLANNYKTVKLENLTLSQGKQVLQVLNGKGSK